MIYHFSDLQRWLDDNLIKCYYDYLMKLANNLDLYNTCLGYTDNDLYSIMNLRIIILFKVNNLLNYLVKLQK
jgi:hypothetical protein